ncbi:MAG: hypothetical protein V3T31_10185, partial [candidate division Zixibacteria bacterium]
MIDNRTKIIVLCTGNACRSQMAEGFISHFLLKNNLSLAAASVRSAGLTVHGVNPLAIKVMAETGIDISGYTSDSIEQYLYETFDFV